MGKKPKVDDWDVSIANVTEEQLRIISDWAGRAAYEAVEKKTAQDKQDRYDNRLHNTRKLLENYRSLVVYANDAVYEASQLEDDYTVKELIDMMCGRADDFTVESIRQRTLEIRTILKHVDKMLNYYQKDCAESGKPDVTRKWDVIYNLYLADGRKTTAEIAKMFLVDERTIYRYKSTAIQDLSALFFGVFE